MWVWLLRTSMSIHNTTHVHMCVPVCGMAGGVCLGQQLFSEMYGVQFSVLVYHADWPMRFIQPLTL